VRTMVANATSLTMQVKSLGTVEPMTAVKLSAQVSGRVVSMSPSLRPGGFFAAGEVLLQIDDADYRLAVAQQQANIARAELRLAQEQAEAESALRAWRQLEADRQPDALATRQLFVAEAQAALAAAKAALARAELDVQRTQVSLPFAGRVRGTDVDVGQQVNAGATLAEVYGIEFAEVRLPIPDQDAAFVDLPLGAQDRAADGRGPAVDVTAQFGGRSHHWSGQVVRTEGEIDRRTRQLTVVARVRDPYATGDDPDRPPLAVGMFVEATIHGRTFDDVVVLPRAAVRADGTVLVVDGENHLRALLVQVLRRDRTQVYVRSGLPPGQRVCISRIDTFVEGMPVHVLQPGDETGAAGGIGSHGIGSGSTDMPAGASAPPDPAILPAGGK
jgi:RND family efflux transporter MFP subunit